MKVSVTGMPVARANSRRAGAAPTRATPLPASTMGLTALLMRSAAAKSSAGAGSGRRTVWRTGRNAIDELASDSLRSSVSSPGIPNTYLTPSASKHSTNTSDALRAFTIPLLAFAVLPRLVLIGTLAVAAMAAPASAPGADRVWIEGRGFGHGVGLSQEGARGLAEHGFDYRRILRHYYRGTSVGRLQPGRSVRVLLQSGGSAVFSGASDVGGVRLQPNRTYAAISTGAGRLEVRAGGRAVARGGSPLQGRGPGPLDFAGGTYRGTLGLSAAGGGVQVVNALGLEDYVRGVVSAESPASWPMEALKAQAVAARGYAVTTSHGAGFDQYADTRSQVYRGVAAETRRTDAAVGATRGEVVTYRGRAVTSYFFAASGGHTENVEDSFVGAPPRPWLKGVPDPHERDAPLHTWRRGPYTRGQLGAKLGDWVRGSFVRVVVTRRGASPRIVHAV